MNQKSQTQTCSEDAVETYLDVLKWAFIVQYKVNQLNDLIQNFKYNLEKNSENNLKLAPRLALCCLLLGIDQSSKKKVVVEIQNPSVIQPTIHQIYTKQVQIHVINVIKCYISKYSQIVQHIKSIQLQNVDETLDSQQFLESQQSLWNQISISTIEDKIKDFNSENLANFVESIIESTRKTKSIENVRKELLSIPLVQNSQTQISSIYEIQSEFVNQGDANVDIQRILIPGLNKSRFIKFSGQVTIYQPSLWNHSKMLSIESEKANIVQREQERINLYLNPQVNEQLIEQVVDIQQLGLNEEFQVFTQWKDILFAIIPRVYNPEKTDYKIDTSKNWHYLLQEPHLRQVVHQLGLSIDRCIWKLTYLNDEQLFTLAGDLPLISKQNNISLRDAIRQLSCSRTLGILIYSGPQQLQDMDSVSHLIKNLDCIHDMLSKK